MGLAKTQKKIKKPIQEAVVLLDSSGDEVNTDSETWKIVSKMELLELPLKASVDLTDFQNFSEFLEVLLMDDVQKNVMPVISVILMFAIMTVKKCPARNFSIAETLGNLLDFQQWKNPEPIMTVLQKEMTRIPVLKLDQDSSGPMANLTLYDSVMILLTKLYWQVETKLETMHLNCITDTWEALPLTCRTYASRRDMQSLFNFMMNYNWAFETVTKERETNFDSYRNTATTSTSSTRALTQTHLAVVHGSKEVQSGGSGDAFDLDDEFLSLDSRFSTGKTSLDISLQTDTLQKQYKAEVQMEEFVYELKIYK